MIYEIIDLSV